MKDPVGSGVPGSDSQQPLGLSSVSSPSSDAYGSKAACLVSPILEVLLGKGVIFLPFVGCHRCEGSSWIWCSR